MYVKCILNINLFYKICSQDLSASIKAKPKQIPELQRAELLEDLAAIKCAIPNTQKLGNI